MLKYLFRALVFKECSAFICADKRNEGKTGYFVDSAYVEQSVLKIGARSCLKATAAEASVSDSGESKLFVDDFTVVIYNAHFSTEFSKEHDYNTENVGERGRYAPFLFQSVCFLGNGTVKSDVDHIDRIIVVTLDKVDSLRLTVELCVDVGEEVAPCEVSREVVARAAGDNAILGVFIKRSGVDYLVERSVAADTDEALLLVRRYT